MLPPTAVQALADVQDTSDRSPTEFGMCWADHFFPFQSSDALSPTAMQAFEEVHDTPLREVGARGTSGVG
jgi:hypothetical protein